MMNSNYPFVIGVSGISGAGKSSLINDLAASLKATTLFWDDFDPISKYPQDYIKWHETSKNYDEWVYDALAKTLKTLKSGQKVICPATQKELHPTPYILFDAPLGYCHKATGKYIDYLVLLDTPPDIALARRLLRDQNKGNLIQDLQEYLERGRPLFILSPEERICDLRLDGSLPLKEQTQIVLSTINKPPKVEITLQAVT